MGGGYLHPVRHSLFLLFGTGFLLWACTEHPRDPEPDQAYVVPDPVALRDAARVARFDSALAGAATEVRYLLEHREEGRRYRAGGEDLYSSVLLPAIYAYRGFVPLWFTHPDSLRQVHEMLQFVNEAGLHGLDPSQYHLAGLESLAEELMAGDTLAATPNLLAHMDVLLTDAWLILASHLYYGKVDQEQLKASWEIRRDKASVPFGDDLAYLMEHHGNVAQAFSKYYPDLGGYTALLAEARRLRGMAPPGADVGGPKASLKPGDSSVYVAAIKERLAYWQLYTPDSTVHPHRYDTLTARAVMRMQEQFGLNPDGAIGSLTLRAMNTTPAKRLEKIYVNMERMRWKPDSLGKRYIVVNIADFRLRYFDGVSLHPALDMRVIVGRNYRATPVFHARMTYLVLSPTWTVPPTIQRNDVLPAVRKDPGYLARNNMRVMDSRGQLLDPAKVDWARDGMRVIIRQLPGARNALGRVKFMFPNKYNVYLHDTPSRELFARDERAFSSGCIRIEKPFELTKALLSDMPGWDENRIRQAMDSSHEQTVTLRTPADIYIYYLTAWGTPTGEVHYRNDLYDRDAEVLKALAAKHPGWN